MGIDDESSHPELCSEVADGVTRNSVCLFRERGAGNLPVRFDEREQETGSRQTGLRRAMRKHPHSHREAKATAPVLDSTRHSAHRGSMSANAWLHQLSIGKRGKIEECCNESTSCDATTSHHPCDGTVQIATSTICQSKEREIGNERVQRSFV